MPLSEHEQRLLEQLEEQLRSEDPKFASTMHSATSAHMGPRRLTLGILAVVVGLVIVLVFGLSMKIIALGVVGFIVMLGGAAWAFIPRKSKSVGNSSGGGSQPHSPSQGSDFMTKLEQRWDRRRDSRG
ncbi:DUF3040 domain-containing protein [Spelaeicoccus albus]|uniref:DUF3040 domain-containing protein n=1 Tax=Spelaeicoccus albus TaxID=1280376 RepID=A0A7Z0IIZ2_9MICO|nr:DUF3040 domain-containing protein [Spelaeicoccus albus]NYI69003.1 hypothetical protein [Spelaeicoccus albus]